MKIIGLLSWYDESPAWLAACVASFAPVLDALVAVDGAYALYPESRATSEQVQAETIMSTCDALGLACTIHRPASRWMKNEVEKRQFLFDLAAPHADQMTDWYWVIDADCVLTSCPGDLRQELRNTDKHAAEVTLWERRDYIGDVPDVARMADLPNESTQRLRSLFRVLDQMQVIGAHYRYRGKIDGEWVWSWSTESELPTPAHSLPMVQVEHRSIWRDQHRRNNAKTYYETRDRLGVERVDRGT